MLCMIKRDRKAYLRNRQAKNLQLLVSTLGATCHQCGGAAGIIEPKDPDKRLHVVSYGSALCKAREAVVTARSHEYQMTCASCRNEWLASHTQQPRKCTRCLVVRPVADFNLKSKGRYQPYCRDCQSVYYKNYYTSNPKEVARILKSNAAMRDSIRSFIRAAKDVPCADCGNKFHPAAMDFDHLPGHKKKFTIASTVTNHSPLEEIKEEMSKCDVVCSNCHRVRTYNRRRK